MDSFRGVRLRFHISAGALAGIPSIALYYISVLVVEAQRAPTTNGGNLWHVAAFAGSILITIGWIVTSANVTKNSQRQHTISAALAYNNNRTVSEHWKTIRRYFPDETAVLEPGVNRVPPYQDRTHPLYRAIDYILDEYEFMALGVNTEAFDAYMVDNAMGYKFAYFYKQMRNYIEHCRRTAGNELWLEYTSLCDRWSKCPPGHLHIFGCCLTKKCKGGI